MDPQWLYTILGGLIVAASGGLGTAMLRKLGSIDMRLGTISEALATTKAQIKAVEDRVIRLENYRDRFINGNGVNLSAFGDE